MPCPRLTVSILRSSIEMKIRPPIEWLLNCFPSATAGALQRFNLRLEAYKAVDRTASGWLSLADERHADGVRAILGEQADVQALTDNYLIMRYPGDERSLLTRITNLVPLDYPATGGRVD